jgi:4-amino-4-deoxychorismate lyase
LLVGADVGGTNVKFVVLGSDGARLAPSAYSSGVSIRQCRTPASVQPHLAGIKSLNRLDQVLARAEWTSPEYYDGVMLDSDGNLICGTMSNVFLVHDNAYSTPFLDRAGVAGIMRQHTLNLLAQAGLPCDQRRLTLDDLESADEVFLTNSQVGAVPVSHYESRQLTVAAATRQVQSLLADNGVPECRA